MRVNLKVLLPTLPEVMGGKELQVEFEGETVRDLFEYLLTRYGRKARQALCDKRGRLDPVIQVLLNGEEWITHDRLDTALRDGDEVIFMMLLAGG